MICKLFKKYALLPFALLASINTQAAIVTAVGSDLTYTYDSSTLFGEGTIIGNNIFFSVENFYAFTAENSDTVSVTDTLDIHISINEYSDLDIETIAWVESGVYSLEGNSAGASASVTTHITGLDDSFTFQEPDSIETLTTGIFNTPNNEAQAPWALTITNDDFDWTGRTSVLYQIQNTLVAYTSDAPDFALIQKGPGQAGIVVNPVPLPASAWLFISALVLIRVLRKNGK